MRNIGSFLLFCGLALFVVIGLGRSSVNWYGNNTHTYAAQAPEPQLPEPEPSSDPFPVAKKTRFIDLSKNDRVIMIDTEVNEGIIKKAEHLTDLQAESSDPIYVVINSPGGSVLDGGVFIGAMKSSRAPVYTVCTQLCASMGAFIHQYGTKRFMLYNAGLMFHPASGGVRGTLEQMAERLHYITRYVDRMGLHVASRAGITLAQYKALSVSERWIESEDAVAHKFAEEIVSIRLPYQTEVLISPPEQVSPAPDNTKWTPPFLYPQNDSSFIKVNELKGFKN